MRAIAIFSLLLIFAVHLAAQSFGPLGTKWAYSEINCFLQPCKSVPFYLNATSEELYQGKMCRKITPSASCTLPNPCYIFDQNDTVYFYSSITAQFEFLYDFNAGPGDEWDIRGLPGSDNNGNNYICHIVIDSVRIRKVNGIPLKVWYFTNDPQIFDWGNEIIEGFGASCFLMPSFGLFEQQICGARCIEWPGTFFQFVDYECNATIIISGTNEPEPERPALFPSPASSSLTISWKTLAASRQIIVSDMTGRQIERFMVANQSEYQLNVGSYAPGMYVLQSDGKAAKFFVQ